MPANVQQSFERGVNALFADVEVKKPEAPGNVFKVWNGLALKFPKLYEFAQCSKRARAAEEKLLLFYKLDPKNEADRQSLAGMFMLHLEQDVSRDLETALDNWWREVSHD